MEDFTKNLIDFGNHPLVAHKITHLCDINTVPKEVCEIINELTMLMGFEALKDLKTKNVTIKAPLAVMDSPVLDENFIVVPILRAGLGMVDGLRTLAPNCKIGHIGLYRDEKTLLPVTYYYKMPEDSLNDECIVVDPALATGGSVDATIKYLKDAGFKKIKVMCIFASDVGVKLLYEKHPDVMIYAAKYIPGGLNEMGYIVTAAGDIGDRINGTVDYRNFK